MAGNIYGRLRDAAPGFVQVAQAQYRDISMRWHKCLGFGVYLPPRGMDKPFEETSVSSTDTAIGHKRSGETLDVLYKRAQEDLRHVYCDAELYKRQRLAVI